MAHIHHQKASHYFKSVPVAIISAQRRKRDQFARKKGMTRILKTIPIQVILVLRNATKIHCFPQKSQYVFRLFKQFFHCFFLNLDFLFSVVPVCVTTCSYVFELFSILPLFVPSQIQKCQQVLLLYS